MRTEAAVNSQGQTDYPTKGKVFLKLIMFHICNTDLSKYTLGKLPLILLYWIEFETLNLVTLYEFGISDF